MAERITDESIDRAAKHLRETLHTGKRLTPWEQTAKATKKKWHALALGTLTAALSTEPGEAEGMVLVPREPTARMLEPFNGLVHFRNTKDNAARIYQAMLALSASESEDAG